MKHLILLILLILTSTIQAQTYQGLFKGGDFATHRKGNEVTFTLTEKPVFNPAYGTQESDYWFEIEVTVVQINNGVSSMKRYKKNFEVWYGVITFPVIANFVVVTAVCHPRSVKNEGQPYVLGQRKMKQFNNSGDLELSTGNF